MHPSHRQQGFSLIELLIVVAIIGIIAAIAIPNLLASRRAANEGSAHASLRAIHSAEATYQVTVGNGEFANLTGLNAEGLVDTLLGGGTKSGYAFVATPVAATAAAPATFLATTIPTQPTGMTQTGSRKFAVATEGVMYGTTASLTVPMTTADMVAANVVGK